MKNPTKEQREELTKQPNDDGVIKKVEVAIAISQAIAVLMFILVLGKLCGM